MKHAKKILIPAVLSTALVSVQATAGEDWEGKAKDAWIDGKVETSYLLNTELNNFAIDTSVEEGEVTLSGKVKSETHRDLAEQIAANISGVESVVNQLEVGEVAEVAPSDKRKFNTVINDLTTSARLKSELLLNKEIKATDISIDTFRAVVTLEGEVDSEAEKMLVEEIALGYDNIVKVENKLTVSSS